MRSSIATLVCLSCAFPSSSDVAGTSSDLPDDSSGDTDVDADADTDVDTTDSGRAQGSSIIGRWSGLCEPSGTGSTPSTIVDMAVAFELREEAGVVEGNGSLTLYSYHAPGADTSDSGGDVEGTVTDQGAVLVTGTWDGTTLTLGFGQPYYNDVYALPFRLVGTVAGDALSAVLTLYPDGSDTYATASWACGFNRL